MSTKKVRILVALMIAWVLLVSAALYPVLPEQIPSHWNTQGEIDDSMGKAWGVFLIPLMALGLFLLLTFLPKIDPRRENIEKFRGHYNNFQVILIAFFLYLHLLILLAGLNETLNFVRWMGVGLGFLFFSIGSLLAHSKRNWIIGIRTPWTLESDHVWNKTHALASRLFQVLGAVVIAGALAVPKLLFWLMLVPLVALVLFCFVYSYVLYRREKK